MSTSAVSQAVTLGGVVVICGLLLGFTYKQTQPMIDSHRQAYAKRLQTDLLNGQTYDADMCKDVLVQTVVVAGYGGDIRFLIARFKQGHVNLRTIAHNETPGIGDFIDQSRDPWIRQLDGLRTTEHDAFDGISGATITLRAVKRAATHGLQLSEVPCE